MLTRWRSLLDTLGLSTFADIVHSTDIAIQSLRSRQHYFDSVRLLLLGAPKHVARVTNKLKMKRSSLTAGRRADLHVVTGVSSYYAVIPSALQKSDEPMWQSRKKASLDESYPSTTLDMVDVVAHLAVQPSVKLCTTRRSLHAPRASR
jgi:hypothetical protein